MKQTTVRDTAYRETYEWLMNDKNGERPHPQDGLHDLALAEWRAGHAAAISYFENYAEEVEEAEIETYIDFTVCVVKVAILYGLFSLGTYIDTWWAMIGSIFAGLAFAWNFMSSRDV